MRRVRSEEEGVHGDDVVALKSDGVQPVPPCTHEVHLDDRDGCASRRSGKSKHIGGGGASAGGDNSYGSGNDYWDDGRSENEGSGSDDWNKHGAGGEDSCQDRRYGAGATSQVEGFGVRPT